MYHSIQLIKVLIRNFSIHSRKVLRKKFTKTFVVIEKKWLKLFVQKNSELSFGKPESTSIARVQGINPESTKRFFDLLRSVIEKLPKRKIFKMLMKLA